MNTDEKGQILPVSLFGLALLCLSMLLVFNTSQLSSKKQQLNDAADAAAYSAALFQARSLNSVAYTNRAMIANQVFIAQVLSVENYLNYWNVKTRNVSWIPGVGQIMGAINTAITSFQNAFTRVSTVAIQGSLFVNGALAIHQRNVVNLAGFEIPILIDRVLRANDPDINPTLLGAGWILESVGSWSDYHEHKNSNDDLKAKADLINRSRDPFTKSRSYDPTLAYWDGKYKINKEGHTTLNVDESGGDVKFRWDALDILSITRRGYGWGSKTRNFLPIGWSRRSVSEDQTKFACPNNALTCENDRVHGLTREFARVEQNEDLRVTGFKLQGYHELKENVGHDPRFPIRLSVSYEQNDIGTSDNVPNMGSVSRSSSSANELGQGVFYQESKPLADNLEAVARAEVYFRRPQQRQDRRDEFANVWNPYWSARLVEPTEERRIARVAKGVL